MTTRRFKQVDVFTDRPLAGNPVAVVLDAEDLDDDVMAAAGRWTNLSETTFVLPPTVPGADFRLRIFTPTTELPFAGHPTIGSVHAVLEAGIVEQKDVVVQECGAGLVQVAVGDDGTIAFEAPEPQITPSPIDAAAIADLLGGVKVEDPLLIDLGPRWLTARLASGARMDDIDVDLAALDRVSRDQGWTGLNIYSVDGGIEVRSLAPAAGAPEDPVCGSGNAAVGMHVRALGLTDTVGSEYTASQGRFLGRDGRIQVRVGDRVWVGGRAVTVIDGGIAI